MELSTSDSLRDRQAYRHPLLPGEDILPAILETVRSMPMLPSTVGAAELSTFPLWEGTTRSVSRDGSWTLTK